MHNSLTKKITATVAVGASKIVFSQGSQPNPNLALFAECDFIATDKEVCFNKFLVGTSTLTSTTTAQVVPVTTLVLDIPKNEARRGIAYLSKCVFLALIAANMWLAL